VAITNTSMEDGAAMDGVLLNIINPIEYYFNTRLTFSTSTFLPHSAFMCYLQISGNTGVAMNVQT